MKRITYLLLTTYYFLLPSVVFALTPDKPPTICAVEGVFKGVLNFAFGFAGLALLVMFIMNGYKWLTAGTNEKGVQEARLGITYSIVGIALMIGAWFALLFIREFTGIDVTVFRIAGCT